jgi:hypothetical protein
VKRYIWLLSLALFIHFFGYYTLAKKIEPFCYYFYLLSWWSYILLLDTILAYRKGHFTIFNGSFPFIVFISCAFWCVFELINLRLGNWSYARLPSAMSERYMAYILAFGTVVPAIQVTKEMLCLLIGEVKVKTFSMQLYPRHAVTMGLLFLFAVYLFPRYLFPATWIFLALILDGVNYSRGYPSFMRQLMDGSAAPLLATLLSGLICGILWEGWNYWSFAKWVYQVPFFNVLKVFEMPLAGYLGFPPFALETVTFVSLLQGSGAFQRYRYAVLAAAIVLSALTFPLIDGYTVLSYAG